MVNLPFKKRGNDQRSVLYQRKALTKNKSSLKAKANRGESYISPLINTNLSYEDFIKLCQNPRKYRLIYVLVNARGAVPYNIMRDFSNLYGEKLMFYYGEMFNFPVASNIAFAKRENLAASADAIENSFDLVGWLNREYL